MRVVADRDLSEFAELASILRASPSRRLRRPTGRARVAPAAPRTMQTTHD